MNVMNGTYDIKNSMLQNVTPVAVRISDTTSYSYGAQPDVSQESSRLLIFNIFGNEIYGSVCSSCCIVVVSIKNALGCRTFHSDSDATYKLCLHNNMVFTNFDVLSQPVHGTATYRCDDTRCCIIQF